MVLLQSPIAPRLKHSATSVKEATSLHPARPRGADQGRGWDLSMRKNGPVPGLRRLRAPRRVHFEVVVDHESRSAAALVEGARQDLGGGDEEAVGLVLGGNRGTGVGAVVEAVKEGSDMYPEVGAQDRVGEFGQRHGACRGEEHLQPLAVLHRCLLIRLTLLQERQRVRVAGAANENLMTSQSTNSEVAGSLSRNHLPAEEVQVLGWPLPAHRADWHGVEALAARHFEARLMEPREWRAAGQLSRRTDSVLQVEQRTDFGHAIVVKAVENLESVLRQVRASGKAVCVLLGSRLSLANVCLLGLNSAVHSSDVLFGDAFALKFALVLGIALQTQAILVLGVALQGESGVILREAVLRHTHRRQRADREVDEFVAHDGRQVVRLRHGRRARHCHRTSGACCSHDLLLAIRRLHEAGVHSLLGFLRNFRRQAA
mmetsp:Transcript_49207/g.124913  ORF Transcript_49207/g.124913 Transcript_49207/m.124913 type:complete len:430 (-) Transcript_49207:21-1310(-)